MKAKTTGNVRLDRELAKIEARELRPEAGRLGEPRLNWHGRVPAIPPDRWPWVLAAAGTDGLLWTHHGMVPGGSPDALAAFHSVADAEWFLTFTGTQRVFRPLKVNQARMARECRYALRQGLSWLMVPRPEPDGRWTMSVLWLEDVVRELGGE